MLIPATAAPDVPPRPLVPVVPGAELDERDVVPVNGGIGRISLRDVPGFGVLLAADVVVRLPLVVGAGVPVDELLPTAKVVAARGVPVTVLAQPASSTAVTAAAAITGSALECRPAIESVPSPLGHPGGPASALGVRSTPCSGGSGKWYRAGFLHTPDPGTSDHRPVRS
jgi:hypothetical protein